MSSAINTQRTARPWLAGVLLPCVAGIAAYLLWPYIHAFTWLFFLPAILHSARIGGWVGGWVSTVVSLLLLCILFVPVVSSGGEPGWVMAVVPGILLACIGMLASALSERDGVVRRRGEGKPALASSSPADGRPSPENDPANVREKWQELDAIRTRQLADLTYELRTPLMLVLAPLKKVLSSRRISGDDKRLLEQAERNARTLQRQVDSLRELGRLDEHDMVVEYAEFDLAHVVRFTASQLELLASQKNICYTSDEPAELMVQGDLKKWQTIVQNLLSNAFRFATSGGLVSLALIERDGDAILDVMDCGEAESEAARELMSESIRHAPPDAAQRSDRTELGLEIVREYAQLQHGSLEAVEAPGGGALFSVRIPLRAPGGTELQTAVPLPDSVGGQDWQAVLHEVSIDRAGLERGDAPLVLIVEDNAEMGSLLAKSLGSHYRVTTAADGDEGLEMALALHPALILTDIMMPRIGGEQMIEAVRLHPEMADVSIMVLTARADEELNLKLLRSGAQDFLVKPFSFEELLARIGVLLNAQARVRDEQRESEARTELFLHTSPNAMLLFDHDGRVQRVNQQAEILFGFPPGTMKGVVVEQLVPQAMRGRHVELRNAYMRSPKPRALGKERDLTACRRDGSEFPAEISLGPIRIHGVTHFVVTVVDITERKAAQEQIRQLNEDLERRVQLRTGELESALHELDALAYAVSHDLRSPLRAIGGFSQILAEDTSNALDDSARAYLERIRRAASRMGELLDSFLVLSRSTSSPIKCETIDVSTTAERILSGFAASEPGRAVTISVEPGLTLTGDPRMLHMTLRNLLSNAWKFTSSKPIATITVSGGQRPDGQTLCVADDGVGFDMNRVGHLFKPFQRLHTEHEFPGRGIGLAIVQRIVHRHGGCVWAEGEPGQGAKFCIGLPPEKAIRDRFSAPEGDLDNAP